MGTQTVLVIGGTGAQGHPVVQELSQHGYRVRVLTRDATSEHAQKLASFGSNVEFVIGAPSNDNDLRAAFSGVDYAFVNLNSFALGIKHELYQGIRIFELAVQSGVKHYVWSALDNYAAETKFDDRLRCGHYYGKGYVTQWMSSISQSLMKWTVVTTGPYIEQLLYFQCPKKQESGEYDFRLPLGEGAIPYVTLDDMGFYVRWVFEHPERSAGLDLQLSIEHVSLNQLATTFTEVTGKPAKATSITTDEWLSETGLPADILQHKVGSSQAAESDSSLLAFAENFSAWWRIYQQSGGDKGLLRRDYALLDEIYPHRISSLKQWMQKVGYDGEARPSPEANKPWGL